VLAWRILALAGAMRGLVKPGTYAVGITGWRLQGEVAHTFRPGTVIPANGSRYAVPDTNSFRVRSNRTPRRHDVEAFFVTWETGGCHGGCQQRWRG